LGQTVSGIIYLDFQGWDPRDNLRVLSVTPKLAPGHLGVVRDHTQTFSFSDTPAGCHSITLVLTHEVDQSEYPHFAPVDLNDTDSRTWWYELGKGPLDDKSTELANCASALVRSVDAGADGATEGGQP